MMKLSCFNVSISSYQYLFVIVFYFFIQFVRTSTGTEIISFADSKEHPSFHPGSGRHKSKVFESDTTACYEEIDPLSCYLDSTTFTPPPELCFQVEEGVIMCLNDLKCHGVQISELPSQYISPTTLRLAVIDFGTFCNGNWNISQQHGGPESGEVNVTITDLDVDLFLAFDKSAETFLPSGIDFSDCTTNLGSVVVKFTGLIRILDIIVEDVLDRMIPKFINTVVCTDLKEFVETNGTDYLLGVVDPALTEIIDSPPTKSPVFRNAIDWSNSTLIKKLDGLINIIEDLLSNILWIRQSEMRAQTTLDHRKSNEVRYWRNAIHGDDWALSDFSIPLDKMILIPTESTQVPIQINLHTLEIRGKIVTAFNLSLPVSFNYS